MPDITHSLDMLTFLFAGSSKGQLDYFPFQMDTPITYVLLMAFTVTLRLLCASAVLLNQVAT